MKTEERITKAPEQAKTGEGHEPKSAHWASPPVAMIVVALLIKVLVLKELGDDPLLQPVGGLDGEAYVTLGRQIASGDLLAGGQTFFLAPLYAYFLGLVFATTGGSLQAARILQIILGAVAVGLVTHTASRASNSSLVGWMAGLLTLLTGVFSFNEVLILQSSLDPFLMAVAMFVLASAASATTMTSGLAAGAALGLLALNRPNTLLVAPVVALAFVMTRRLRPGVVFLLGFILAIAPATLRNAAVSKDFVLISSHGGLNLYIGNNAHADGSYKAVPGITPQIEGQTRDARALADKAMGRSLRQSEVSAYFMNLAWSFWRDDPKAALRLFARKLGLTLNSVDLSLNQSFTYYQKVESRVLRALVVGPLVLVPLGILGLVAAFLRFGAPAAPLLVLGPAYALSVALFFVSSRYRMPLLIPLAFLSAVGIDWAVTAFLERRWRSVALSLALASGGLAIALHNFGLDDGSSEEEIANIEFLVDNRRNDEARARMVAAQTRARDVDALRLRIGRAFLHQGEVGPATALLSQVEGSLIKEERLAIAEYFLVAGDPFSATRFFEAAMKTGQARTASLLARYGEALSLSGNGAGAVAALRESLALAPERPRVLLNLAVTLANMGRFDEAKVEVLAVLKFEPGNEKARGLLKALESAAPPPPPGVTR